MKFKIGDKVRWKRNRYTILREADFTGYVFIQRVVPKNELKRGWKK